MKLQKNQVNFQVKEGKFFIKMFGHLFTKERRTELRFPVALPLFYLALGSPEKVDGQTRDISQGGVCVATDREVPIGAQIDLLLRMIDTDETIHQQGTVIWTAKYSDQTYRIGIKLGTTKLKPVPLVLRTIMTLSEAHSAKKTS